MRKLLNEELNRLDVDGYKSAQKAPVIVVLDNIRSLNNIGSAFRTSDAFRVEAIYLCGITAVPPHRDIQKTALGATESVDWKYFKTTEEAVRELKSNSYYVVAIEQANESVDLENFKINTGKKYGFIFGNEVKGVEDNVILLSDEVVEIPQFGTKHSLNISVSVGIVLWDFLLKYRRLK
ncbi:MAG: RNA methyltransferase [Bacteroidales bacterium]|nr:RNA methyltransferase [Bacteroidales bacterium]